MVLLLLIAMRSNNENLRVSLSTQRLYVGPGDSGVCVEGGRWYWLIGTSYNLLSLWRDVTTSRLMFSHAGVLCVVCQCLCCSTSVYAMISSQQHTEWIISIDPQLWTNITFQYRFCQGKSSNICVVSAQLCTSCTSFDYINSGNWKNWRFIVLRQQQWKPETVWSVSVCISVSMSWEISVLQPAVPPPHFSVLTQFTDRSLEFTMKSEPDKIPAVLPIRCIYSYLWIRVTSKLNQSMLWASRLLGPE